MAIRPKSIRQTRCIAGGLDEQPLDCGQVLATECGDTSVKGMGSTGDHADRDEVVGRTCDPTRRVDASSVAVKQQRQHHSWVVGALRVEGALPSGVFSLDGSIDLGEIHLAHQVDEEVAEILLLQPI